MLLVARTPECLPVCDGDHADRIPDRVRPFARSLARRKNRAHRPVDGGARDIEDRRDARDNGEDPAS